MAAQPDLSARNVARRVPCPHCGYRAQGVGSMPAHIAMAHPELAAAGDAPACVGSNHVPGCDHFPAAPAASPPLPGAAILELPVDLVDVGDNVRVNPDELEELAASIAEHGVLQPIKATGPHADGRYLVTWGQRRTLASRIAGRATVPAIVLPPDADVDAHGAPRAIEQLVENLHRADLNPIDRATAMRAVVDAGISQVDLARKLGIAASTVSNDLRLLGLDSGVVERIRVGELSASHGKAIASLPAKQQRQIAERVARDKLSTKDLERELEWKRAEAQVDEAKATRTEKALPRLVPALEAAGVPKDAVVGLGLSSYSFDHDAVRKAIAAGGWTGATDAYTYGRERPPAGKCDCTAVRLEAAGRSIKVVAICTNDRHQDRQRNVDRQAEEERRTAIAAKVADLRARVRVALEDVPIPILLLAVDEAYDLPALIANADVSDESRSALRDLAAARLVRVADSSREWDADRRAARDKALDAMLELFPPAEASA